MENNMQIFENEQFGKIRGMEINGEPWLVGRDFALALGYERPDNAICLHIDEDDRLTHQISALGQHHQRLCIMSF